MDFTFVTLNDGEPVTISSYDANDDKVKYINNYYMTDYSGNNRRLLDDNATAMKVKKLQ